MPEAPREPAATTAAAGRVAASLIEGLHLRFELFVLELGQERDRAVELVLLCLVVVLAGFMLLLCANLAVLVFFWEDHRLPAALGLVAFYAIVMAVSVLLFRVRRGKQGEPFAASREVLTQDIEGAQSIGKPLQ